MKTLTETDNLGSFTFMVVAVIVALILLCCHPISFSEVRHFDDKATAWVNQNTQGTGLDHLKEDLGNSFDHLTEKTSGSAVDAGYDFRSSINNR